MPAEIEHKYLVHSDLYKEMAISRSEIIQGYLSKDPERTVRIRIRDNKGFLTVKGLTIGDTRQEFEYEIPVSDAEEMLSLCLPSPIRKIRWIVVHEGFKWEVDEFLAPSVMTIAEIELPSGDTDYPLPSFVGENVTGDPRFYNSNL